MDAQRPVSATSTLKDVPFTEKDSAPMHVEEETFIINKFAEGDPENPKNWSRGKRWYLTMLSGLLFLNSTFASSAPSSIVPQLMEEFHLSSLVGILTISLFVAGYCVGPILWGPLSEVYGRRPIFIFPFFAYMMFTLGGALAKNTASVLIFRFIGGTFAAAPQTNSGAMIADIWDPETRGKAIAIFTLAPFAGPALGPIVGGFVGENVSWRWVFWVMTAFAGVCWILALLTMPETYAPVLLARQAKRKRKATDDERYYAPLDKRDTSLKSRMENILAKPFAILFSEPMLMALTLYMSFIYGCIYLLFAAYPIVFTQGHHLSPGISGLMFLAIPIGAMFGVILYVNYYNPSYERKANEIRPKLVPPEFRLNCTLVPSVLYAGTFFWFGWTSFPSISFAAPMTSGFVTGFAVELLYLGLFNYIVDAYLPVAASALAASTVVRSLFGAAFPLFAGKMYEGLKPQWASTLLGFIALLMIPIPFVLQRFGPRLRASSKYCPTEEVSPSAPLE
ncbi:major facilitator superfamily domain-containing protein [Crepidotus variabilis]|uniref:Major facilitator superfamily domain-containing protein n=1 Tax=Crepidotus variabilis TaxID=179855 RepID=A0A9P6E7Q9_9AGAR|nr:major facilitator superfamily domain-containing protein [Crepidotus variabilis]